MYYCCLYSLIYALYITIYVLLLFIFSNICSIYSLLMLYVSLMYSLLFAFSIYLVYMFSLFPVYVFSIDLACFCILSSLAAFDLYLIDVIYLLTMEGVGGPIWFYTTAVHRSPLPYDQIQEWQVCCS